MANDFHPGGCERCGRPAEHAGDITWFRWQFLCRECRDILSFEATQEHEHVRHQAELERLEQIVEHAAG